MLSRMMTSWPYVIACVLVPAAWGAFMYFAFNAVERRRTAKMASNGSPTADDAT